MTAPGPQTALSDLRLEDAIEIIERRKWWVLLGSLLGLALGAALYPLLPPRYESSTIILVEPQRVPEAYIQSTVTLEIEQRLNTLFQRVTSFSNLNQLIDTVGPERLDPTGKLTREEVMRRIRESLDVEIADGGHRGSAPVFELSFSGPDAQVVADVVREMAALFIAENLKDRAQQATATAEFLDRELARLRTEVSEQEERIRAFRFERMGELPSQLDANLRALDRLNLELASNLEAQESATQRITLLRSQLSAAADADAPTAPKPGTVGAALSAAHQELIQARRIYTDQHPNVVHLREEIERLEREVSEEAESVQAVGTTNPTLVALRRETDAAVMDLDARRRQEQRIRARIEDLQVRVEETPRREQEEIALTRDYDNLMNTYRSLLAKKYEAALARNLEQAQHGERFKVLRPAQVPEEPGWPTLKLLLPGGLGFGLLLAGLGIAIAEIRNPAFRSVDRLTRMIGLPVFASIPGIDSDQIYEEPPTGEVDPKLVVHTAPESAPAEQYRGFLPSFLAAKDCRVILVTSAARGDGKTLTCMNVAGTLAADLNRRVLVIDGDLRRPKAHRLLNLRRTDGLSDILRRRATLADCAVNSKISNLALLPAGHSVRNPLGLLTSPAFLEVLQEARKRYDVVMIDSPPLLPVVDTKILRMMADMVLFVVRADATPRTAAIRSLREMGDAAGVIFNYVSPGSFRRYYYYDAYSRYAYGDPPTPDELAEETKRG